MHRALYTFLILTSLLIGCRTPTTFPRNQIIPTYALPITIRTAEEKLTMESTITAQILEFEDKLEANLGFAFRDLNDPDFIMFHNGDKLFHAASTMKISVMIETFRQAETGKFNMSDLRVVTNEFKSIVDGSPYKVAGEDFLEKQVGKEVTILTLVEQMMVVSDNLATNLLLEIVGPENVTATMRELGAMDGSVLRGVEDIPAFKAGISNRVTPRDLMELLTAIHQGRAGNAESTKEMTRILLDQQFMDMIPKHLPKSVAVGHKTGTITAHCHDAGIVYAPTGPYVLVLMSENLKDSDDGKKAIAKVSKQLFELLEENAQR